MTTSLWPSCFVRLLCLCSLLGWLAGEAAARPNVLFCIADDASCHYGQAYDCDWVKTPNIDRLAQQGVVFNNAYTPAAKCAPARASILTGRNPWQLEEAGNHQAYFPAKFKAFSEVLRETGMHVGASGKTWGPGSAKTAEGQPRDFALTKAGGGRKGANDPAAHFRDFLTQRPKDAPFFFWFGSSNPHRAYTPDAGLAAGKKIADVDRVPAFWPDNDVVRRDMLDYATEVEAFDAQVGSLLKVLEEGGQADDTLVLVTSDHGMPFPRVKGHTYELSHHVPLVASWPRGIGQRGRRVADFVGLVDLAPTLLDLCGADGERAGMSPITGNSFVDLLAGRPKRDRSFLILGRERHDVRARPGTETGLGYPSRGIRQGRLLYIHNFAADRWPCGNPELGLLDTDASPTKQLINDRGDSDRFWQLCFGKRPADELFDVTSDPDCVKNLANDPAQASTLASLRDKLFAQLRQQQDPRILGGGDAFDNYPTVKPPPKK